MHAKHCVITVRPASRGDLEAIAAIYAHAVVHGTASYELEPPSLREMTLRFERLAQDRYPFLAADLDGVFAGYAYGSAFRTRPAYRFLIETSVYVSPPAKGLGVGRALLGALITQAERLGFRQMVAVIGDGAATNPSVKLHRSLGFREAGKLLGSGYKHGRWLDTLFMQLALNAGTDTAPDS